MRQADGLLDIHPPVSPGDDGLCHIADDAAATGRADRQRGFAVLQNNGRRHGGTRPLARFKPVGNRHPVAMRPEGEIGQFVVQQEPRRHHPRAKAVFDGCRHRQDVAVLIHDGDMRGRGKFDRLVICKIQGVIKGGIARCHLWQRIVPRQQVCPVSQIVLCHQALGRHWDEIAVGHVAATIRKGETRGIADQPPGLGIVSAKGCEIIVAQHAEDLAHGQRPGGRRAHATGLECAIGDTDGGAFLDLIESQIHRRQQPRISLCSAHCRGDRLCDGTGIEPLRAIAGDVAQRVAIGGVGEGCPLCQGRSTRQEIGGGLRPARQAVSVAFDQTGQTWRHAKAAISQRNRVLEQAGPVGLSPAPVRGLHQGRCARRADRAPADNGIKELHRFAVFVLKQTWRGRQRRGFTTIQRGHFAGFGIIPDQKRTTAKARGLRLYQTQHALHGDHRVCGRATCLQHLGPGGNRMRIGCGHHPVVGLHRCPCGLGLQCGGDLWADVGKLCRNGCSGTFRGNGVGGLLRHGGACRGTGGEHPQNNG